VQLGVNVPNFGPGTDPDVLRRWALTVEGLGFDLLMVSDHVAVTPDVAEQYPAPFYEPFTTLAWLAGLTRRIRLGTTVLILPYRHPLLTARMAANLNDLSGWLAGGLDRMKVIAAELGRSQPALVPRIALHLTSSPVTGDDRLAGHGTIAQIAGDLEQLRSLGADTVVLDPFNGDPAETTHPEAAWRALATVADRCTE